MTRFKAGTVSFSHLQVVQIITECDQKANACMFRSIHIILVIFNLSFIIMNMNGTCTKA